MNINKLVERAPVVGSFMFPFFFGKQLHGRGYDPRRIKLWREGLVDVSPAPEPDQSVPVSEVGHGRGPVGAIAAVDPGLEIEAPRAISKTNPAAATARHDGITSVSAPAGSACSTVTPGAGWVYGVVFWVLVGKAVAFVCRKLRLGRIDGTVESDAVDDLDLSSLGEQENWAEGEDDASRGQREEHLLAAKKQAENEAAAARVENKELSEKLKAAEEDASERKAEDETRIANLQSERHELREWLRTAQQSPAQARETLDEQSTNTAKLFNDLRALRETASIATAEHMDKLDAARAEIEHLNASLESAQATAAAQAAASSARYSEVENARASVIQTLASEQAIHDEKVAALSDNEGLLLSLVEELKGKLKTAEVSCREAVEAGAVELAEAKGALEAKDKEVGLSCCAVMGVFPDRVVLL